MQETAPEPDNRSTMADASDVKQSAFKPRLNVPTNDGTMRITVRWTPANKELSHSKHPGSWAAEALLMLTDLFPDASGSFYQWESTDLAMWKTVSQFTTDELRDYQSPSVTYILLRVCTSLAYVLASQQETRQNAGRNNKVHEKLCETTKYGRPSRTHPATAGICAMRVIY